jgi:O-antigen ligase
MTYPKINNIFSDSNRRGANFVSLSLFLISLAYVCLFLFDEDIAKNISVALLFLGFVSFFFLKRSYWLNAPLVLMVLSIIWVTSVWLVVSAEFPENARSGPAVEDYIDKFLFIFIGIGLAGSKSREVFFVSVAASVIVFMPWISGSGFSDLMEALDGVRQGFGLSPIRSGMLAAFVFILSSVFLVRAAFSVTVKWPVVIAWAGLMFWALLLIIFSQTRAVFVSIFIMFTFGFIFMATKRRINAIQLRRVALIVLALTALLVSFSFISGASDRNIDRMGQDLTVVSDLFTEDLEDLPQSSWGVRAIMLRYGIGRFVERPFWGWGYRSSNELLEKAHDDKILDQEFSQFHNSYLEILVEYGIFGLLILVLLFSYLLVSLSGSIKNSSGKNEMPIAIFIFLSFMGIFSFFDGILVQESSGPFIFNVAAGVALSIIFRSKLSEAAGSSQIDSDCGRERLSPTRNPH